MMLSLRLTHKIPLFLSLCLALAGCAQTNTVSCPQNDGPKAQPQQAYAHIVQANNTLFMRDGYPAAWALVAFSLDPKIQPSQINKLATEAFRLKREEPQNASERLLSEAVRSEQVSASNYYVRVAPELGYGDNTHLASLLVCREHLFGGVLSLGNQSFQIVVPLDQESRPIPRYAPIMAASLARKKGQLCPVPSWAR